MCLPCRYPCSECLSEHQCLTCQIGYLQPSAMACHPICPPTTYLNTTTFHCLDCPPPCLNCHSPSSCYSCLPDMYLVQSTGHCLTPAHCP